MADQYYRTFFMSNVHFDVESSNRFDDLDTIILPKNNNYLAFNFKYLHVLRLNQHPHPLDITLAAAEPSWRLIPLDRFLETGPSFTRDLLSGMGVPSPGTVHDMALDICSFVLLHIVAPQPLYSRLKVLTFSLEVTAVTPFDERRETEPVLVESAMQDSVCTVTPTAPSFVEALKSVDEGDRERSVGKESCTICLEEFVSDDDDEEDGVGVGVQVVSVTCCSHRFHKDCIVRWFETSHVCPLCRYAMPPLISALDFL